MTDVKNVEYQVNLWNAQIKHGISGHMPMQFDMANDQNDVQPGRTTGTRVSYEQKKRLNGGVIPYCTFDRRQLFNSPQQQVVLTYVRSAKGEQKLVAKGDLAFVVTSSGEFRVAIPASRGTGRFNHSHIADMATDVLYAGTLSFSTSGSREGVLNFWNSDSGAYRCDKKAAQSAGLPMERFENPRWKGLDLAALLAAK